MWLKVAAIAALCVTDAVAQRPAATIMQNCTTQDQNELFRYCLDTNGVVPATRLFWNPANADGVISFAFEAPAGAWRAVGFSDAGGMAPANVVMGCIPAAVPARGFALNAQGADFMLTAQNLNGVNQAGNQNLVTWTQNINMTVTPPLCTVRFSRPVDIGNQPLQLLNDRVQNVIAARGMDGDVTINANHVTGMGNGGRGSFTVNFANPVPDMPPGMPTMPGQTNAPGGNGASTLGASITLVSAIVGSIYVALW